MKTVDLSIIIPTHGRPKTLNCLLTSLKKFLPTTLKIEVIVISNFKESRTEKVVLSFSEVLPIIYKVANKLGVNRARNLGLSYANGDIILFLDDDCVVLSSEYFFNHINYHAKFPMYVAIGGPYTNSTSTNTVGRVYNLNAQSWIEKDITTDHLAQNLLGGNTSYKASVFNGRVHFNENIVFGGAETELNQRLIEENHLLGYFPDLQIEHNPPISIFNLCKKAYLQGLGCKEGLSAPDPSNSKNSFKDVPSSVLEKTILKIYALFYITGVRTRMKNTNLNDVNASSLSLVKNFMRALWFVYLYRLEAPYHFAKRYAWKIQWLMCVPINYAKLKGWKLKKPIYYLKLHLWKLKKPAHFLKFHFWKLKKPILFIRLHLWKLKKPIYYLKLHLWKLKKPIYYLQIFYFNTAKKTYLLATKVGPRLLKPYYFCKYQYNKRIKFKNSNSNLN